jgi:hypothetical protein
MIWQTVKAPWWDDKPVALVANGPSLKGFDCGKLVGRFHILAIKGAIFDLPFADAGIGLDMPRYMEWCHRLAKVPYPVYWAFPEIQHFRVRNVLGKNIIVLKRGGKEVPSNRADVINGGGSSGYAAIELAMHKRARQIVLLGFDYTANGGRVMHVNDTPYKASRFQTADAWIRWARNIDNMKPALERAGAEMVNGSPASRIKAFPRMTPDEAIQHFHRLRPARGGSVCGLPVLDPSAAGTAG